MALPRATTFAPGKPAVWGVSIRRKRTAAAWDALTKLFHECTVPEPPSAVDFNVRPHSALAITLARFATGAALQSPMLSSLAHPEYLRTLERFGAPRHTLDAEGGGMWRLAAADLDAAVAVMLAQEQVSDDPLASDLSFMRQFRWRDPRTHEALAHQSATAVEGDAERGECPPNSVMVTLRWREVHLMTHLWFPFAYGSAELGEFLGALAPLLPFKLAVSHFREAIPSADGMRYQTTKAKPGRARAQ